MDSLLFAVNAVAPLILLILVGYILRRIKIIDESFLKSLNKIVFNFFMPVLLFANLYDLESLDNINWGFILYAYVGTVAMFFIGILVAKLFIPEKQYKGTVIQSVFRANNMVLGLPLATALFGAEGAALASLLVLTTPLLNVFSILTFTIYDHKKSKKLTIGLVLHEIIKNPLNIGVFIAIVTLIVRALFISYGIEFRLTDIPGFYPAIKYVAAVTTPIALIMLGGQFEFKSATNYIKPIIVGTTFRLIVIPALALTITYFMFPNFGGAAYAAAVALFATPAAVVSAVIAKEMGGDDNLAGQIVVWSTLFSIPSMIIIIVILRTIGIF
ncbi:MAG: AEC family transporter [Candidatus Izemoplasmatales bacterium]|nr:AEC family transporter [Candidatus Izemoplasmatales bacterium]MDD3865645.1 AEC family transporter [Candidatus Izemoplasmatales bacterium]